MHSSRTGVCFAILLPVSPEITNALPYFVAGAWAAFAAAIAWHVGTVVRDAAAVASREGRAGSAALPLSFRVLLPLAPLVRPVVSRPAFARARERIDRDIVSAGLDGAVTGEEILALRFLCPAAEGTLFTLLAFTGTSFAPDSFLHDIRGPFCAAVFLLLAASPVQWVRSTLKKRHLSIAKALPFVLDLLTLSVEAGMDFMAALQRGCATRKPDALGEELSRMTREIQLGTPRRKALKNMSERVRHPDLKSVCAALIQADELGVSIGAILRIQSDQMRSRRFDRAEKLANEAPVKMLGPLMLCIFPAVFIILLGPVMAQASHGLL